MVIVILGILAAVAIPKFVDLKTEAQDSVAEGVGGALGSAITMLHTQLILNNAAYDATSVVGSIDSSNLEGLTAAAGIITATVKGKLYTWTYTANAGSGAAGQIEGPN